VINKFSNTPSERLWLLPRPHKNVDGSHHLSANLLLAWMRTWVERIPRIDSGPLEERGEPAPFDRAAIHPHAFRHTYAQTLADQGIAPSVLRDIMDHRSLSTTLGYYQVGEARKRAAMEVLARHTIDNLGVTRPAEGEPSRVARQREQLTSWSPRGTRPLRSVQRKLRGSIAAKKVLRLEAGTAPLVGPCLEHRDETQVPKPK